MIFSLTFRFLLFLLLRSPPPSPSSFSLSPPAFVLPLDSFFADPHVRSTGDFDYVFDCDLPTMRDFDCDYPGPGLVLWRSRPGRPSGPSSRAGFPLRLRRLGGPGSAMNPVDPLTPSGGSAPVPRVAGVILPAPVWFAGAGGVCRFRPCGSRGWRGVHGLTPRRAPSAVRGGAI